VLAQLRRSVLVDAFSRGRTSTRDGHRVFGVSRTRYLGDARRPRRSNFGGHYGQRQRLAKSSGIPGRRPRPSCRYFAATRASAAHERVLETARAAGSIPPSSAAAHGARHRSEKRRDGSAERIAMNTPPGHPRGSPQASMLAFEEPPTPARHVLTVHDELSSRYRKPRWTSPRSASARPWNPCTPGVPLVGGRRPGQKWSEAH